MIYFFLNPLKMESLVEKHLDDNIDTFIDVNAYNEFDNEIPNFEWRITILDQSLDLLLQQHPSLKNKI